MQEFRVITQNYSAQYEKASSAIITAVTKSGGNEFNGEAFVFYQPKGWVAELPKDFQFSTLTHEHRRTSATSRPQHRRPDHQGQAALLPLLRRRSTSTAQRSPVTTPATPQLRQPVRPVRRQLPQPVQARTWPSAKLSWQPAPDQLVDFSGNYRTRARDPRLRRHRPASSRRPTSRTGSTARPAAPQWNTRQRAEPGRR